VRSPQVTEREVKSIFVLNVFQSLAERAHTVDVLARASERVCHDRESHHEAPRVTGGWEEPERLERRFVRLVTTHSRLKSSEERAYEEDPPSIHTNP
jgi:hypothetical protein